MEQNPQTYQVSPVEFSEVQDPSSDYLMAQNKSEIDMQISTAKRYPRDIHRSLDDIVTWGTMDDETAQSCFYSLARNGESGQNAVEGLSVRMAEIIAEAWGNIRCGSRVIASDGKTITGQGYCFDLERNVCVVTEVRQRITKKNGQPMSEDMQVTIANSACSKAFRNAVLKVVPKAITASAVSKIKAVAMGKAVNMTETRSKIVSSFAAIGVKEAQLLEYLEVKDRDSITQDDVMHLRGLYTAIKEGDTTVEDSIVSTIKDRKRNAEAAKTANSVSEAIKMAAQTSDFQANKQESIKK